MRIKLASVFVDDQERAHDFYTRVAGFVTKQDLPAGGARWLTVVSPQEPDGTELVLEPDWNPALTGRMAELKRSFVENRIPFTGFEVDDVDAQYERMRALGAVFAMTPETMGPVRVAVVEDGCGNLIQIYQLVSPS